MIPTKFKSLFWDFELKNLSTKDHAEFIVSRVLAKGNLESLSWLVKIYGYQLLLKYCLESHNLDQTTKNFWINFAKYNEISA